MKRITSTPLSDADAAFALQLWKERAAGLRKNQARTREGILRQQDELATIARILAAVSVEEADDPLSLPPATR